jgi:Pro-kumamolisin, activation domain
VHLLTRITLVVLAALMLGGLLPAAAQKGVNGSAPTSTATTSDQTIEPSFGSQQTSDQPKNCDPAQQTCDQPKPPSWPCDRQHTGCGPQQTFSPQDIPKPVDHGCDRARPCEAGMDRLERDCDDCDRRPDCGLREGPCELRADEARRGCCEAPPESCCEPRREGCCEARCEEHERCCDNAKADGGPPWKPASPATLTISEFVIYAERSLDIGECGKVRRGDLGVRSLADKSAGPQLKIGKNSVVDTEHLVIAPSATIGRDVKLGAVRADQFTDDGVPLIPLEPFVPAAMPPLPLATGSSTGGSDVVVGAHQALALLPGTYGALKIDGVLLLNPGRYVVSSLTMGDFARMRAITGNVTMSIAETLRTGRQAVIESDFDLPARHFAISVAGQDGAGTPAASMGEHGRIRALLAAPHGTLSFADHVRATGAFAAFDVAIGADARIEYEDGFAADAPGDHGSQKLSGYLTAPIIAAPIVGPVPASEVISIAVGLPVSNPAALRTAAQQVSDPKSPQFRKYLTPSQFAATYGPAAPDYQSLINWAKANGLTIDRTYSNRMLLDVSGTAAQIEEALFIGLNLRERPDGSHFYALDRDPSLDFGVPVLWISGLDTRSPAVPNGAPGPNVANAGTGPNGNYNSSDIRTAYAACSPPRTGAGQTLGLFELDGFTPSDISAYECASGGATCNAAGVVTSTVPTVNVVSLDNATGGPVTVNGSFEVTLDIEMALAMAPGLTQINVFETPNTGNVRFSNDILTSMATTLPLSNQLSSSWDFAFDANTQPILYQMAIQGQSFFQSSGDQGSSSWGTDPGDIRDLDAVTVVGGTTLTMTGPPQAYGSEATWNVSASGASGGGVAGNATLPGYQSGVDMTKNSGSTTNRNLPDVSAVAAGVSVVVTNPTTGVQNAGGNAVGTSVAAPLWAAFVALANEEAQSSPTGIGTVGNANAFLYSLGENTTAYGPSFNDVASGNNNGTCVGQSGLSSGVCAVTVQVLSPPPPKTVIANTWKPGAGNFSAIAGYDLATGWGTPKCALISELANGAPTAAPPTPPTITYHQTGACNAYVNSFGGVSAGPNAAFVMFGIEQIDNSASAKPFAFDPTKLYVQQAKQEFVDPSLSIYADIFGPFAAIPTSVAAGFDMKFSPSAQAALTVQTVNVDGATEANNTSYLLRYNSSATDPPVLFTKSDAPPWPLTQDCTAIMLH